ncbi:MAG TPA: response regulator [Trichormus sp.]|jgi:CheY-like chemotaxis protein
MQQEEQKMILVVEDDDALRFLTTKQLQRLGFIVHSANNGKEAVAKVTQNAHNYSLVLMDVQMPKMDGIEATTKIRQMESANQSHVPIVAMTAHPEEARCLEAGMDDFIFKPVMLEQLKSVLSKWVPVPPPHSVPSTTTRT